MLNYTTYKHKTAKDWVTFVHGAGGSSSIWYQQIRSFSANFNVLVVDLRGHGKSKPSIKDTFKQKYTFNAITNDIVEVLDFLKIEKSHFAGISLGTILIRNLAENYPKRVKSMVMGGAIMSMNFKSKVLLRTGIIFKSVVSYMLLYKLFAFVIMPKKNHKKSRLLFFQSKRHSNSYLIYYGRRRSFIFTCHKKCCFSASSSITFSSKKMWSCGEC
jgi:pimeloyl-ACP methyl ester carboxylesterase